MKTFLKIALALSFVLGFVYPEQASQTLNNACQWISHLWKAGNEKAPSLKKWAQKVWHPQSLEKGDQDD